MQKLIDGIHAFQSQVFATKQELFNGLAAGQQPPALFITCSDSRIDPNLLTQTEPGELFILRNAGNIVPEYGSGDGGEAATIEYAVNVLKVQDIIICGHSHCGAMAGLLAPESLGGLPAVKGWLRNAESTQKIIADNYGHVEDAADRLSVCINENVLVQIEQLKTHPSVAAALEKGELKLHAWVYKFENGQVFVYQPDSNQFIPMTNESNEGAG